MAAPVRSMTGFARVRRSTSDGDFTLSLRSVNHRALDLHFHLPAEFDPYEAAMRRAIAAAIVRGHVDVRAQFSRSACEAAPRFNRPLLEAWVQAWRAAQAEYDLRGEPDLNAALRIPGMLGDTAAADLGEGFEAAILEALGEALSTLNSERAREGAATAAVLRSHARRILETVEAIEGIREGVVPSIRGRLEERLAELLRAVSPDPARLAQEAAILADRSDISEELARLRIHHTRLIEILDGGGETGKKLDFLLQEMHRETNTILSKGSGAGEAGRQLSALALTMKSEIEKIREQSLNLE